MISRKSAIIIRAVVLSLIVTLGATSTSSGAQAAPATKSRIATVYFASDSSVVSSSMQAQVRKAVKTTSNVDHYIVTGYVQNSGADHNNKWLSLRRAKMVRGVMHKFGVTAPIIVRAGGVPQHKGRTATARRVTIVAVMKASTPSSPTTPVSPYAPDRVTVIADQDSVTSGNPAGDPSYYLTANWFPHGANDCGMGGCPNFIVIDQLTNTFVPTTSDIDVAIQNDTFYLSSVVLNDSTECPLSQGLNIYVCEHVHLGDHITITQGSLKPVG